jgi:hypothetical protein
MVARVNGETWSEGNTKDMYWKINELVEYASMDETIHPGSILGTGTAGNGSGVELGKFLKPNDVVELQIEGLGTLRNVIGRKASKDPKILSHRYLYLEFSRLESDRREPERACSRNVFPVVSIASRRIHRLIRTGIEALAIVPKIRPN